MRIEFGGAFADLLNEKGKGSGDNEMGYVERTLGFCTRDLDDRDLRLVHLLLKFIYLFTLSFTLEVAISTYLLMSGWVQVIICIYQAKRVN